MHVSLIKVSSHFYIIQNATVAIKKTSLAGRDARAQEKCLREARLITSLSSTHRNLLSCLDALLVVEKGAQAYLIVVTEWAEAGDLARVIRKAQKEERRIHGGLCEARVWGCLEQLCAGIEHLHKAKIVHGDLTPSHVLCDGQGTLKVGGVSISQSRVRPPTLHGLLPEAAPASQAMGAGEKKRRKPVPVYAPPEILRGDGPGWKSDTWSLGCLAFEMGAGRPPFQLGEGGVEGLLAAMGLGGEELAWPEGFSKELRDLVNSMLSVDPAKRPDVERVRETARRIGITRGGGPRWEQRRGNGGGEGLRWVRAMETGENVEAGSEKGWSAWPTPSPARRGRGKLLEGRWTKEAEKKKGGKREEANTDQGPETALPASESRATGGSLPGQGPLTSALDGAGSGGQGEGSMEAWSSEDDTRPQGRRQEEDLLEAVVARLSLQPPSRAVGTEMGWQGPENIPQSLSRGLGPTGLEAWGGSPEPLGRPVGATGREERPCTVESMKAGIRCLQGQLQSLQSKVAEKHRRIRDLDAALLRVEWALADRREGKGLGRSEVSEKKGIKYGKSGLGLMEVRETVKQLQEENRDMRLRTGFLLQMLGELRARKAEAARRKRQRLRRGQQFQRRRVWGDGKSAEKSGWEADGL